MSVDRLPDEQLVEASFLPATPGLEPAVVLYGVTELTPGQWRRAELALEIPEAARRITIPVGDPANPRFAQTRLLGVPDAIPWLLSRTGKAGRPSLNVWVIAAHVAVRIHEGALRPVHDPQTRASLEKLAASMPPTSHSVITDTGADDDDLLGAGGQNGAEDTTCLLTAYEALDAFLDSSVRALAMGIAQKRASERSKSSFKRGELSGLVLRLRMPRTRAARWTLEVGLAEEDQTGAKLPGKLTAFAAKKRELLDLASERCPRLAPVLTVDIAGTDNIIELEEDQAGMIVMSTPDLAAGGAVVELPDRLLAEVGGRFEANIRFRKKKTASTSKVHYRLEDIASYDLEIALGGKAVSAAELRELAKAASGLVRLGDDWIALNDSNRDHLEAIARAIESHDATMAGSRALSAALAGEAAMPGGIVAKVASIEDEALARAVEFLKQPVSFPSTNAGDGFEGELRPYQRTGVGWLQGMSQIPLGAVLADDMGLGKTVQVIAYLSLLRASKKKDSPRILVVCPTSLIGNWERELGHFGPDIPVHVHHGPGRANTLAKLDPKAEVVITSYGIVARDSEMLSGERWSTIVFDEAQAVKNPDTEQARAVRMLNADFRVALTGTPMENRLLELWAILDLVNPGLLGTAANFNRRFAIPIERGNDEAATERLRSITKPFMLRRIKNDPEIVPDLPEKFEHTVTCTLTPEQAALYQATVDNTMNDVRRRDGIGRRGAVLALVTRLKQICNHPAQMLGEEGPLSERSGKLDRLTSMLSEVVSEGDRALVFTQYAQMGKLLVPYLEEQLGCEVLYLHGGVPRQKREELVARFQDDKGDPLVFVLSLKAGGLGLNLMSAAHVFHYDRWWNPAVEDQATDRTHRIGQTRSIQVHKMVCAGTLEERIAAIVEGKRKLVGKVIDVSAGSGEGWLTELSDEELQDLVELTGTSRQFVDKEAEVAADVSAGEKQESSV